MLKGWNHVDPPVVERAARRGSADSSTDKKRVLVEVSDNEENEYSEGPPTTTSAASGSSQFWLNCLEDSKENGVLSSPSIPTPATVVASRPYSFDESSHNTSAEMSATQPRNETKQPEINQNKQPLTLGNSNTHVHHGTGRIHGTHTDPPSRSMESIFTSRSSVLSFSPDSDTRDSAATKTQNYGFLNASSKASTNILDTADGNAQPTTDTATATLSHETSSLAAQQPPQQKKPDQQHKRQNQVEGDSFAWAYDVWKRKGLMQASRGKTRTKVATGPVATKIEQFEDQVIEKEKHRNKSQRYSSEKMGRHVNKDMSEAQTTPRESQFHLTVNSYKQAKSHEGRHSLSAVEAGGRRERTGFTNVLEKWKTQSEHNSNGHFLSPGQMSSHPDEQSQPVLDSKRRSISTLKVASESVVTTAPTAVPRTSQKNEFVPDRISSTKIAARLREKEQVPESAAPSPKTQAARIKSRYMIARRPSQSRSRRQSATQIGTTQTHAVGAASGVRAHFGATKSPPRSRGDFKSAVRKVLGRAEADNVFEPQPMAPQRETSDELRSKSAPRFRNMGERRDPVSPGSPSRVGSPFEGRSRSTPRSGRKVDIVKTYKARSAYSSPTEDGTRREATKSAANLDTPRSECYSNPSPESASQTARQREPGVALQDIPSQKESPFDRELRSKSAPRSGRRLKPAESPRASPKRKSDLFERQVRSKSAPRVGRLMAKAYEKRASLSPSPTKNTPFEPEPRSTSTRTSRRQPMASAGSQTQTPSGFDNELQQVASARAPTVSSNQSHERQHQPKSATRYARKSLDLHTSPKESLPLENTPVVRVKDLLQLSADRRTSRASFASIPSQVLINPDTETVYSVAESHLTDLHADKIDCGLEPSPREGMSSRGVEKDSPWTKQICSKLETIQAEERTTPKCEINSDRPWRRDALVNRVDTMVDQSMSMVITEEGPCQCSSTVLSEKDDVIEFFMPLMGTGCTCGKGTKGLRNPEEPTAIENILRPWQVKFLAGFGIYRGDHLVKAHHRSANALATALRQYRKKQKMTPFKTKSCALALNIWAKTSRAFVRSIRKQLTSGTQELKLPNTLYILSSFLERLPTEETLGDSATRSLSSGAPAQIPNSHGGP